MDHLIQGDHYKDLQKEIAEDLLLAHLSAQTLPHSILLGSKYIPMWQVGAQYRRALTAGDIAFQRRWL